ncbi:rho GTPase-activating protein 20-like [Oscarella lobularis]|uniref:rho GTPase-activating protein 20-like n=1 Tax=Oscarella lobularis TaxID=121494 RepID=UPI003313E296
MHLYLGSAKVKLGQKATDHRLFWYLYLFSDVLLIAKQKSSSSYHLKNHVRLSDMWLADCVDEVSEFSNSGESSFVIGWPTTNAVVTFGCPEEKELWYCLFERLLMKQQEFVEPKVTTVKIHNKAVLTSSALQLVTLKVTKTDTTTSTVEKALEQLDCDVSV